MTPIPRPNLSLIVTDGLKAGQVFELVRHHWGIPLEQAGVNQHGTPPPGPPPTA